MIKYISVDVETAGPHPLLYSMLSLGACVVGQTEKQFYRELKPFKMHYELAAMRIACLGLKVLEEFKGNELYDPRSEIFNPELALVALAQKGTEPKEAIMDFHDWIREVTKGCQPKLAAGPTAFDAKFIDYYFCLYMRNLNPFGHTGEDIKSMYRGYKHDLNANISELAKDERKVAHNALEDAIQQAKEFEELLKLMKVQY